MPDRRHPDPHRKAFTLIELLVVMGVIGLMLGIGVPFFTGIGRGTAVRTATARVDSTLSLARQWAVTHRERIFVVFPRDNAQTSTGLGEMPYRTFGVYSPSDGYLREWSFLPDGVVFDSTFSEANKWGNVFNTAAYQFDASFEGFSGDQPCVTFRPDGSILRRGMTSTTMKPIIPITEGWPNPALAAGMEARPNGMMNVVEMHILTGTTKIHER